MSSVRKGPSKRSGNILLAMAKAVCPVDIDVADRQQRTVDHLAKSIQSLPRAMQRAIAVALRGFEYSAVLSFGKRASQLEREALEQYADTWKNSTLAPKREFWRGVGGLAKLAYYELQDVQKELDYTPSAWVKDVAKKRLAVYQSAIEKQERRILSADPLPGIATSPQKNTRQGSRPSAKHKVVDCDVCVVGSGAGGSVIAAELAEAGYSVALIEEGSHKTTKDFTTNASAMVRDLYRDAGATVALGTPPVLYQEGKTVGGSTVINGGMSWRTPSPILEHWAKTHGVTTSAKDMEPYFERVEKRIHVAKQDPHTIGRDNHILREAAHKKGWQVIGNLRNQVHCAGSNNCAFGCPTGAKQSALVTYIPRALHFGAQIFAQTRADKILFKGKQAVGVRARQKDGSSIRFRSKLVVSSCGAIHTPALLHRSGVRSPSGKLGRNLSLHPNAKVIAIFDDEVRGFEGVHQAFQVREFHKEGFLFAAVNIPPSLVAMTSSHQGDHLHNLMKSYNKMVVAGMLLEDTHFGRVRVDPIGNPHAFYNISDRDAASLQRGISLLCDMLFSVGARRILLPILGGPEVTSMDQVQKVFAHKVSKDRFELLTVHMMGTAAMGGDKTRHVLDPYGAVYDAHRLFVADASMFPSPIGVNPAETIQALATRTAHHILSNHKRYL